MVSQIFVFFWPLLRSTVNAFPRLKGRVEDEARTKARTDAAGDPPNTGAVFHAPGDPRAGTGSDEPTR